MRPAGAADERQDGSDEILAALERDLGLTREQAEEQGALQERAIKLDARLQRALGDAYAGAWYDLESGQLVVNVTDEAALEKAQGGRRRRPARQAQPARAERDQGSSWTPPQGRRRAAPSGRPATSRRDIGLSAWSIDPITNSVLVTVTAEQADAAKQLLAEYGDAVTIEETPSAPETTANFMDGGDAINGGSCSAGFNLRNPSTGARFLLTAGHCVSAGSTLTGQGGVTLRHGARELVPDLRRRDHPQPATPRFWIQGPWVDTNPSNGGIVTSSGSTDGLVGTVVCKSGITTKWTCGQITAKNETVTYTGGHTVYGLTRHNACVEPGDSGGANVSVFGSTRRAEGVTSGASLIEWGGARSAASAPSSAGSASRTRRGTSRSPTASPTTARSTASPPGDHD